MFKMKISIITSTVLLVFLAGCASREKIASDVRATIAAQTATNPEERRTAEILAATKKDVRLREAYALGQLQAAKSLYQAINNTQNTDASDADRTQAGLVPLTVPERKVGGVIVNEGVEYVRLPQ